MVLCSHLPFVDHRHRLVPIDRSSRRIEDSESQTLSDQALDPPVILFDPIVQASTRDQLSR